MKIAGTIVTTTIEYVEVDVEDAEVGLSELFMRAALNTSDKKSIGKSVQFVPLANISLPKTPYITQDGDEALAIALARAFSFDTDTREMGIFRDKLAEFGLAVTSKERETR